jgi:hypothetical protein
MGEFYSRVADIAVGKLKVPKYVLVPGSEEGNASDIEEDRYVNEDQTWLTQLNERRLGAAAVAPLLSIDGGVCVGPETPETHESKAEATAEAKVEAPGGLDDSGGATVIAACDEERQEPAASEPAVVFPLAVLRGAAGGGLPEGVDARCKEAYLSAAEFTAQFGMSRGDFARLPAWKRQAAKKKAGLF